MDKYKQILESLIKESCIKNFQNEKQFQIEIFTPQNPSFGDLSTNIALKLSNQFKMKPFDIATKIANSISTNKIVKKIEVVEPGFINFYLNFNPREILDNIFKTEFIQKESLKDKVILVEHTSPNPNKAYHIGHLKNTVTGISTSNLFETFGAKVYRDCINNNRGISIAIMMFGYLKYGRKDNSLDPTLENWNKNPESWKTPESEKKDSDKFMAEMYVLGNQDVEKNSESKEFVKKMVIDWENEEPINRKLWELTQRWVWNGYEKILRRIGAWNFDKIWNESDFYNDGKDLVRDGVAKGIFKVLPDGAILSDLKNFGLTDTILLKNDGTSLYITQDIALSKMKRDFFRADEMYWVIGPEQSLAMKQMFAVSSQLGILNFSEFHHLPYGFVLKRTNDGKGEKMASRRGTQIYVDELIEYSKKRIRNYINEDFSEIEKDKIAEKIAIASIKYALLKIERTKDLIFDIDISISIEGDSAPYILYAYTRALSILNENTILKENINYVPNSEEIEFTIELNKFEEILEKSLIELDTSNIAKYIYTLSKQFNSFYSHNRILNSEGEEFRLRLTKAFQLIIKKGLEILGIEPVEKM